MRSRAASAADPRAARDAPHPRELRARRRDGPTRTRTALLARHDLRRRPHQRDDRARPRRQPQSNRSLVRSLDTQTPQVLVEARIVEATSTYTRDIGIQWGGDGAASPAPRQSHGPGVPEFHRTWPVVLHRPQNITAGLSPSATDVPNPNYAVNLPATVGSGVGGAVGLTLGSINGNVNINVRLSACEIERPAAHREFAAHPHARQPRGTDRARHVDPVLAGQRAGRSDRVPGSEATAPRRPHVTADGSISMHVASRATNPTSTTPARVATRPFSSAKPRPTCSSPTDTPRSSAGSTPATPARNLDQVPVPRRHPDPRRAVPASPQQRRAHRVARSS